MTPGVVLVASGLALCVRASSVATSVASDDSVCAVAASSYVQIPGHMEFSGRLLVRPLQPNGAGDAGFAGRDEVARALLGPFVVEHFAELDLYVVQVPDGSDDSSFGSELAQTGLYEYVRPDWILYPLGSPNDPDIPLQWQLRKIAAPGAWRFTTGAPNLIVAFVDTGVEPTHPDLAGNLVPGFCSHWSWRNTHPSGGNVSDDNGHGTSVAGAGIAIADNGVGGCGVGWGLRIMPIRATNPGTATGGASSSDIIAGAKWAADHGAKVVSCSWSGVAESFVETLGQTLRGKGALLVWPMDETGQATTFDHPNVVVVNGTNQTDALQDPSCNWGPGVDLAAPAKSLWVPIKGGTYGWRTGNSFAAPIVAASAGLVWSLDPTMTPLEVEHALEWSAKDIGPSGTDDYFGHGRVDPYVALVNMIIGNIGHPQMPRMANPDDIVNALAQWHVDR